MIRILLPAEQYLSACESTLLFNKHKEQSVNKERDIKMYELEKQRDKECGKVLQKILIEQNLPPQSLILKSTGNSEKQVSNVESLGSKDKTQLLNLACALLTLQRSTKLVLEKVIEQEALRVVNEAANGNNAFAIQFLEEYWVMQKKGNNPTIIDIE
jgi:Na+-transporting methylmalonyl-CoA/oxaloacetate decarboxylase beta subunit